MEKKKKIWIITAGVLVVAIVCGLLVVKYQKKHRYKVRTKPNTTYSGSALERDPEELWKEIHLDMITPQSYGQAESIAIQPGATIALIGKESGTDFWDAVKAGAEAAAEDLNEALGYKKDDEKVTITYSAPSAGENAEEQINILDETLGRNPSAICIAMIDKKACEVQFDQASGNGIPVVALDSGNDNDTLISICATDNYSAAREMTNSICQDIGDAGSIVILAHDDSSEAATDRLDGILQEIEQNHTSVTVGKISYLTGMEESGMIEMAVNVMKDEKNPPKAVIATNATALAALEKAYDELDEEQQKKVMIYGFDGGQDEIDRIEDGTLGGFVLQNPYGMGYASVIAAARGLAGAPNESEVSTGYLYVNSDNYNTDKVNAMLYD